MKHIVFGLLVAMAGSGFAAPAANWSAVPLDKWTEARTVDSCTEGIPPEGMPKVMPNDGRMPLPVPEPPFGTWKEVNGTLQATGLANCWSTMLQPGDQQDVVVTTRFTVQKSSGAARQLPGGCVRWGFHWGENLPGWDAGVVLGYQDALNFYRVQLSAARGELALWDATGGFLQLIPCKVALGEPHTLVIRWRGAHLTATLDGAQVMDYWDQTLPYAHGQVGLAVWKSAVQFDQFAVARDAGKAETMPAHEPDFRFAPTTNILTEHPGFHMTPRDGIILFDGNEPISYYYKQEMDKGGDMSRGSMIQEAVKLKPGWRPAYFSYLGPPGNDGNFPVLQGDLPDAFKVTSLGKVLAFTYQTEWKKALRTDYTCTVRYDDKRGVYRYEFKGVARAIAPASFNEFELYDPYVYNNRVPGPEVIHRWNPAGHRWWVYQGGNDAWLRAPITDFIGDYNSEFNNSTPQWGKCSDFLYPDPAACPLFENEIGWAKPQNRSYNLGLCTWGYDYHHREVGGRLEMKVGDERPFAFTFTALPPAEAETLYKQSQLPPALLADKQVILPFVPNGDTFAQTTTQQDPSCQMAWSGGVRDETIGHGDKFSLRIDGPGKAGVKIRQFAIEAYAKRWWMRGWVKTKGVAAPGLTLSIVYPGYANDVFKLGAGDQEWTYFSFTTSAFLIRDETTVTFNLPGGGTAWIDDFAISALKDNEQPKVTGVAEGK